MYGGMVTGNRALRGGGVCIKAYCTFNMYGGIICDNQCYNATTYGGGGLMVETRSSFNMYGEFMLAVT